MDQIEFEYNEPKSCVDLYSIGLRFGAQQRFAEGIEEGINDAEHAVEEDRGEAPSPEISSEDLEFIRTVSVPILEAERAERIQLHANPFDRASQRAEDAWKEFGHRMAILAARLLKVPANREVI